MQVYFCNNVHLCATDFSVGKEKQDNDSPF